MPREQSNEGLRCEHCGGLYGPSSSCDPCPYCEVERLKTRLDNCGHYAALVLASEIWIYQKPLIEKIVAEAAEE